MSDDDHNTDEDSSEEDDETRSRGSRASNKGGTRRSSRKADRPAKSVKLTPGDSDAVSFNLVFSGFYNIFKTLCVSSEILHVYFLGLLSLVCIT